MAVFFSGYIQQPPAKHHVMHVNSTNHVRKNVPSYGTHKINIDPYLMPATK